MSEFQDFLKEQLKDEKFKAEWDRLELRYRVIEQILKLRMKYDLTQKQFAEKVGTTQAVISRIENGNVNIGIDFLDRVAKAFGKKVEVKLI
ncbi:helix-turn-helix transcriptional regulator [Sulfurimonas sp. HSL-3221]|uniref:helix-turn-helix domain-containing protein n=1 Tax=Thiomicrolovo sulfuroxydans TaxID=2894755 RepID=UPI001E356066|nr:helix-turn-helix transcriptional regulator [Sulfurimonas sp. HSL-3221]UFS63637.1 helix-turn-helix transcriptional regulator [Sulfurimonas sp. HSL-3221]